MAFLAFLDQMAYREYQAFPDRRGPREGKVQKGKLKIRDRKECRVQKETEDAEGFLEKVDPEESRE